MTAVLDRTDIGFLEEAVFGCELENEWDAAEDGLLPEAVGCGGCTNECSSCTGCQGTCAGNQR